MPLSENSEAPPTVDNSSGDSGRKGHPDTTVILFDWDDTLCPSSHLSSKGYNLESKITCQDTEMGLRALEASVISLLELAFTFGEVHIVTNAETGWVQLSASKFIPGVLPLLGRTKVTSARSMYENMFPQQPFKWKLWAFKENLSLSSEPANSRVFKNVLSFGDSQFEREAIRHVTLGVPNTKTKSVKFKERPSMEQLRRQIELVISCFQYIHNHDGDLDLHLSISHHDSTDSGNEFDNDDAFNPVDEDIPSVEHATTGPGVHATNPVAQYAGTFNQK